MHLHYELGIDLILTRKRLERVVVWLCSGSRWDLVILVRFFEFFEICCRSTPS